MSDPLIESAAQQRGGPSKLTPQFVSTVIAQLLDLADKHPSTRLATTASALARQLLSLTKDHPEADQAYSLIRHLGEVILLREKVRLLEQESCDSKANAERYVWYRDRIISEMEEPMTAEQFDCDVDQKRRFSGS